MCRLGGFNVQKLMEIKQWLIDIGKNIWFTFSKMHENVYFFEPLHFKFGFNSIITSKNVVLHKYNMGIKQSRILRWFQICLLKYEQNHPKKVKDKRSLKKARIVKNSKFDQLFRYIFFKSILLKPNQQLWNQHNILRFFPILYFGVKLFLGSY